MLPPISGTEYDLQLIVGGTVQHRVITTLQKWKASSDVWSGLAGKTRVDDKRLRDACETCRKFEAIDDIHASSSYRQHLATVMARRALEQACARLPSRAAAPARAH